MNNTIISKASRVLFMLIAALVMSANGLFAQSVNTYEYDNLNRLTKTTYANGVIVQYTYDAVGNRTSKTVTGTVGSFIITVSANPAEGGTVSGGGTYQQGQNCTLTATANTDYTFDHWTKNGTTISGGATISFTVTESATYVAFFTTQGQSYTISTAVSPVGSGYVTGGGTYQQGQTCTLTAIPNSGYAFDHWVKNGMTISGGTTISFTVTQTSNYVAYFTTSQGQNYTITASANPTAGGTVSGGGTYQSGQTCTLTAMANSGYTFTNWKENGNVVSTNASYIFTVTANRTLVANFTATSSDYHWSVNVNQYPNTMTVVGIIQINGEEQATDMLEIGAFCGNECRGREKPYYVTVLNRYVLFLTLYGNDSDVLNFRLYDHSIGQELDLTCATTVTFVTNGELGTPVNPYVFNFTDTQTQTSALAGGWTWWSTYIETTGNDVLNQLETGFGSNGMTIKSQNGFVQYSPEYSIWFGSPNFSVSNELCYMLQTSAACEVEVTGNLAHPANHPITISNGWNWIGYPCTSHMSFASAFSGITPTDGDQVKSQSHGFASFMGSYNIWFGTLQEYGVDPGMGLMYKSNNSNSYTLIYPNGRGDEELVGHYFAENTHWTADYKAYPNNMTVTAVVELDDVELSSDNYELAAFANGECRGSVRLMYVAPLNRYMAFLTIAGEDATELTFGLYNTETGTVETQCITSLQYETNAVVGSLETPYVIRFRSMTGLDDWVSSLQIFPNPVACGELISLGSIDEIGVAQIEIINALGVVVETWRAASLQTMTAPMVSGVYTLRITGEGKGTCYRKLVVR